MLVSDCSTVIVAHVLSPANGVNISLLLIKICKRSVILDPEHNGTKLMRDVFVKLVGGLVALKNCGLTLCLVDLDLYLTTYFIFPAITNTDVNPSVLNLNDWFDFFVIRRFPSLLFASLN